MREMMCPFCMNPVQDETCPFCGRTVNYTGHLTHLPVGYTLYGRKTYVLGAALGQGGFGITYIALDPENGQRVAIKEYYPSHCCTRANSAGVESGYGQEETYNKGKQRFILEGQMLQSLSDLDSVVKVLDYFEGNNSAYLVMEYLDGLSLKDHVQKNGKLPVQAFLNQMKPLLADMEKMHQRGVVHRDIAPDNIILLPDGRLKLIDFGAARSYIGDKSMTVVVKKGFAPVEQYMRKGSNASTDIYALAATIYYCITGIVPPDSAERQYGEAILQEPSDLGINISKTQEQALEKALSIQPKDRTQSVSELAGSLYASDAVDAFSLNQKTVKKTVLTGKYDMPVSEKVKGTAPVKSNKSLGKWVIPLAAAVGLTIGGIFLLSRPESQPEETVAIDVPVAEPQPEVIATEDQMPRLPDQTYVMSSAGYGEYYFWGQTEYNSDEVRVLRFAGSLEDAPEAAHDISEAQDRSVLMWMNDGVLTVAANGRISPGSDASRMFSGWANLEHIDFGNVFDTSDVTNMAHMFQGCAKLTKLDLSCFDTAKVTRMASMFQGCGSLELLNVASFDTSHVTDMSYMFYYCEKLTALDLRGFRTSCVTSASYMFGECKSLSVLDVGGFDTSSITNMTSMFMNCHAVKYLDVSGFDTSRVETMYYMFYNCAALSSLDVSSFDTSHVNNMGYMFYGCKGLAGLDVSNFEIAEGTYTYDMFGGCSFVMPDWYEQ